MNSPTPTVKRPLKPIAQIIALVVLLIALASLYSFHNFREQNLLSEDAVIQAEVVHISPAIPGKLVELAVEEGSRVKQGDLLYRLDPEIYRWTLQQAEAELAMATAALNSKNRLIKAESANAQIANEQIRRAQTNLALATRTVNRLRPLVEEGYATQQELDVAVTAQRDAQVSLTQAGVQYQAAEHLIGEIDAALAAVQAAEASVAIAAKALADTEVRAPHDGLVVGLHVSTGERLAPGQSLFTLINTQHWYAQALYLETELTSIAIGDCVSVYALADPKREMQGRVINIGWGVNNEEVINLPRSLPYVQKSLNWVRVAQRFPVRILLQDPPAELMRMGASATATVRVGRSCQ